MAEFSIDYELKRDGKKVELAVKAMDERLRFNPKTAPESVFGTNYKVVLPSGSLFLIGSTTRGPEIGVGGYKKANEENPKPENKRAFISSVVLYGTDMTLDPVKPSFEFNNEDDAIRYKAEFDEAIGIFVDRLNGIGLEEEIPEIDDIEEDIDTNNDSEDIDPNYREEYDEYDIDEEDNDFER